MAADHSIGKIFVELDLDTTQYTKSQRAILEGARTTSLNVEKNWRTIGEKSDIMYNAMRQNILNAYDMIKNKAGTTAAEIVRLEQAKNAKLKALDEQQFGRQVSLIEKLKTNWLALTASITAAYYTIRQAWGMAEIAAEFEETRGVLNTFATQYGKTADMIISDIQKMSDGLISMSDAAKIATESMGRGMSPDQLNELAKASTLMGDAFKEAFGGSALAAFQRMTEGVSKGRRAFLQLGIDIGISKDAIEKAKTEQERFNLIMERYNEISLTVGERTDSTADKMERLKVILKDLQLWMGGVLLKAGLAVAGVFFSIASAFYAIDAAVYKMRQGIAWLTDTLGITKGSYVSLGIAAEEAKVKSMDFAVKAQQYFDATDKSAADLASGMAALKPPPDTEDKIKKIGGAMKEVGDANAHIKAYEAYLEEWKKKVSEEVDFRKKIEGEIIDVEMQGLDRALAENKRHYDDLRDEAKQYIIDYAELKKVQTVIDQLEAGKRVQIEKQFADKAVDANKVIADDYLKTFEEINRDLMGIFEGFFYEITGNAEDAFKDFGQWLMNYFRHLLAQMATFAIANPIIVPLAQQAGAAMASPLAAGAGFGAMAGSIMGGTGGMVGGAAGGLLAGTTFGTTAILGGMESLLGASIMGTLGTSLNFIVPVIGGLIGAGIGKLVEDLLSSGHSPNLQLGTMGTPNQAWTNRFGEGDFTLRKWNELGQKNTETILKVFETVKDQMETFMTEMGMDISKLGEQWKSSMADADSNIKNVIQRWIGEYATFLTGINFKEFQKSGEEMADTVSRVITAIGGMKTLGENIDTVISYLDDSTDAFTQFRTAMNDLDRQITDTKNSMAGLTDPSEVFDAANQLYGLMVQKYQAEIQFVQQLEQSIKALKIEFAQFTSAISRRIADLGGSPAGLNTAIDMIAKAGIDLANNIMNPDFSLEEKYPMLQDFLSYLDEWYELNLDKIQMLGEAEIEVYEANIDALEKQLELVQGWKSVLESTRKMIFDLKAGMTNPEDALARLDFVRSEIQRIQSLFRGSSGEEQMGYASQLQELIQQYGSIGQEAFQRPSSEWQAIYDEMIGWLQEIEGVSAEGAKKAEDILSDIERWQSKIVATNDRMASAIDALNTEARVYYQWAQSAGTEIYTGKIAGLESTLSALLGPGGTVAGYIELSRTTLQAELSGVRDYLNSILYSLTGYNAMANAVPSYAVGTDYVPKTGLAMLHQGEKVISAGQGGGMAITVAPQITINSSGDASPKDIAREVESILISSLKYGKGRIAVQEIQRSRR